MRRFIKIAALLLACIIGIGGIRAFYVFVVDETGDTSHVTINYGHSKLYSQKEREAAAKTILRKFASFENCRLEKLSYTSDKQSQQELKQRKKMDTRRYQEGYDKKNVAKSYDDCIVFISVFTTGSDPDPGFSPHDRYNGWRWIVVRRKSGSWRLYAYGHE